MTLHTPTRLFSRSLSILLLALGLCAARADQEQDLIATLRSDADAVKKCDACQQLRVVGTVKCVPAVAPLLLDETTSQAARYALEPMPCPEAGAALRKALRSTTGLVQAGLADSLGWRHDAAAVPLLKPLLRSTNVVVAAAAATALGRIGNRSATSALVSARDKVPPPVQPAVLNAILQSAEQRLAAQDSKGAASLYEKVYATKYPDRFRVAAWRGIVVADTRQRAKLVSAALAGNDAALRLAALKVVRELRDASVVKACVEEWPALSAPCQLAVLDAQVAVGGEVLPTVRLAARSPYPTVRAAAWLALCDLGDVSTLDALAQAAAHGDAAERDAAREALTRVRGPGVREAILGQIPKAAPEERAELLRALGDRGDTEAAGVLLENATAPGPVRLAALESLRKLAVPGTLVPLLQIAAKSGTDTDAEPALKATYAVCQASKDKDQTTRSVLEAMAHLPPAERQVVLPLLAELGTPAALEAAEAAAREQDPELVKQAVRVLGQWPNSAPAPMLLELARTADSASLRVLALRGCIDVAALDPDKTNRFQILEQARAAATRPDEKRQVLGKLGQIPTPAALSLVVADLSEPDLANEAAMAAITIAEQVSTSNVKLAGDAADQVLKQCKNSDLTRRAMALHIKAAGRGPFIQDWLVCGPFRKKNLNDLSGIFKEPFGPERPNAKVQWKPAPHGDGVNLLELFPNQENCAAYLKTRIAAPEECDAYLLLGSDDGVKAWLNKTIVHTNDVNRGDVPDQDVAPIHLKQGNNDLMLKITQGGGGWSAHARIVGNDGHPIPGLRTGPDVKPERAAAAPQGKS
ncbi:MAG TPA: HEAT repeat domain-containing protein [Candidatus Acidoferrum sp.]|nr:HEAT repeat domain-containing protein [Candidatus Acidoferrum sp.]